MVPIKEAVRRVVRRTNETYLYGGVRASYDGFQVWISADRDGLRHEIALEAQTIEALNEYIKRLIQESKTDGA